MPHLQILQLLASDELLEAIREVEQGEVIHCKDFEEYKANIDNE